jgi:hypothetical protein
MATPRIMAPMFSRQWLEQIMPRPAVAIVADQTATTPALRVVLGLPDSADRETGV